jgi:hypothetical protein
MNGVMKNGLKVVVAGLALMADSVMANPILMPTQVSIGDYSGSTNAQYWRDNGPYAGSGGAWSMSVYDQNGDSMDTLVAFCLEANESISTNGTRYSISMDNYAAHGGRGGQTPQEPNRDYLSNESAWLYFETARKDGSGNYDGAYGNAVLWGDVQHAIWMLENEIDDDAHLQYILSKQYGNSNWNAHFVSITDMISAARAAVDAGWSNNEGIVVYNLWEGNLGSSARQSMIAFEIPSTGGQNPVPEPAVFLLIVGGLLGLASRKCRRIH